MTRDGHIFVWRRSLQSSTFPYLNDIISIDHPWAIVATGGGCLCIISFLVICCYLRIYRNRAQPPANAQPQPQPQQSKRTVAKTVTANTVHDVENQLGTNAIHDNTKKRKKLLQQMSARESSPSSALSGRRHSHAEKHIRTPRSPPVPDDTTSVVDVTINDSPTDERKKLLPPPKSPHDSALSSALAGRRHSHADKHIKIHRLKDHHVEQEQEEEVEEEEEEEEEEEQEQEQEQEEHNEKRSDDRSGDESSPHNRVTTSLDTLFPSVTSPLQAKLDQSTTPLAEHSTANLQSNSQSDSQSNSQSKTQSNEPTSPSVEASPTPTPTPTPTPSLSTDLEQLLSIRRITLGDQHPHTLSAMNNLAGTTITHLLILLNPSLTTILTLYHTLKNIP